MTFFESEEHRVAALVRRVSLLMHRARQNELTYLGVTPVQVGVLLFAQKFEKTCTIKQLRESLYRSNSAMVGIINRMERDGLVQRKVDNDNKRHTLILVTSKGKVLYKKAVNSNAFATIIKSIPEEDVQRLEMILNTLNNAAQKLLGI